MVVLADRMGNAEAKAGAERFRAYDDRLLFEPYPAKQERLKALLAEFLELYGESGER